MNILFGRLRSAIGSVPHLEGPRLSSLMEEISAWVADLPEVERPAAPTAFPDGPTRTAAEAGAWRTAVLLCAGSRLGSEDALLFVSAPKDEREGLHLGPAVSSALLPILPARMRPALAQSVIDDLRNDDSDVDWKVTVLLPALPYLGGQALRDVFAQVLRYVRHSGQADSQPYLTSANRPAGGDAASVDTRAGLRLWRQLWRIRAEISPIGSSATFFRRSRLPRRAPGCCRPWPM